ncbi:MAG: SSU ribosomal protein S21p [uncultured Caballeronia sp.]|nr:MAG: SSU ribosomal protein S21p [uncultured Caballeronia sp.]
MSWMVRRCWQRRGVLVTSRPNREMCPERCARFPAFAAENDTVNSQQQTAPKRAFTSFFRRRMPLRRLNPNSLFSGLRGRFARVRRAAHCRVRRTIGVPGRGGFIVARLEIRLANQDLHDHYRPQRKRAVRCRDSAFPPHLERNGLTAELRERQSYEKPTTERKHKKAAAVARLRSQMLPKKMH